MFLPWHASYWKVGRGAHFHTGGGRNTSVSVAAGCESPVVPGRAAVPHASPNVRADLSEHYQPPALSLGDKSQSDF